MTNVEYVKVSDCLLREEAMSAFNNNLNKLVDVLNHRVTGLEVSVKWIKWIMTYMAVIVTVSTLLGGVKFLFS